MDKIKILDYFNLNSKLAFLKATVEGSIFYIKLDNPIDINYTSTPKNLKYSNTNFIGSASLDNTIIHANIDTGYIIYEKNDSLCFFDIKNKIKNTYTTFFGNDGLIEKPDVFINIYPCIKYNDLLNNFTVSIMFIHKSSIKIENILYNAAERNIIDYNNNFNKFTNISPQYLTNLTASINNIKEQLYQLRNIKSDAANYDVDHDKIYSNIQKRIEILYGILNHINAIVELSKNLQSMNNSLDSLFENLNFVSSGLNLIL